MILADLVGIPWKIGGRNTTGTDCVGLAIMAQKAINNRELHFLQVYNMYNIYQKSRIIRDEIMQMCVPIETPEEGSLGLFFFPGGVETPGGWHVVTFVDGERFLHIFEERESRISRLTPAYRRYLEGVYTWRERQ